MRMSSSESLFPIFKEGHSVAGVSLLLYLEWAASNIGEFPQQLLLPPIQRGFVWKPVQVVTLWDSLLRGMPIGSFMLNELSSHEQARTLSANQAHKTLDLTQPALGLLDGQQRTLAMLLVTSELEEGPDRRIWLDLSEAGHQGSPFELRMTTKTQPFGFQRRTHTKLPISERRRARASFNHAYPEYAQLLDHELGLEKTRPWKGDRVHAVDAMVPLRDLWSSFRAAGVNSDAWAESVIAKHKLEESDTIVGRLRQLYEAFRRLETAEVPLILVRPFPATQELEHPSEDPLTLLFERIATGGTRLGPDDLLFSMIKQVWPAAHDLVQSIQATPIGYLMKPTDFVTTAFRQAMALDGRVDKAQPDAKDFHAHLGQLLGSEAEPGTLRALIAGAEEKRLIRAFGVLYEILVYRGGDDFGIPRIMLPHLQRPLLQVLLRWVLRELNAGVDVHALMTSRRSILAFSLYWFIFENDGNKASVEAFRVLASERPGTGFPGKRLYASLTRVENDQQPLMLPLVRPEQLADAIDGTLSSTYRNGPQQLFKQSESVDQAYMRAAFNRLWWRKSALLWLQRDYLTKAFATYDPLAGQEDDETVPYDFDHLCPQAHWGGDLRTLKSSTRRSDPTFNEVTFQRKLTYRYVTGNSIGNFHILAAGTNRSLADSPLSAKFKVLADQEVTEADSVFFPNEQTRALWEKASPSDGDHHSWNDERIESFQAAVLHRSLDLYGRYFDGCRAIYEDSNNMNDSWPDTLIDQTRSALQMPPMTLDGNLSFKNVDGRFGQIVLTDLVSGTMRVTDRHSGEPHVYASANELIAAGWAVD
jgi:Protein of unknown function DUF262